MRVAWDEEGAAAERISLVLPVRRWQRRDPGGGPLQLWDLDLLLHDGRTVAVEVTREVDGMDLGAHAETNKRDWTSVLLTGTWVVGFVDGFNVKAAHGKVFDLVATLEATGAQELATRDVPNDPLGQSLSELGVRHVYRLLERGSEILPGRASQGGTTAPDVVTAIAQDHLDRPDNLAKLRAAGLAAERHLYVWAETWPARATMSFGHLPRRSPTLPTFVDVLWVGQGYEPGRLWRYDETHGWKDCRPAGSKPSTS